MEQTTLQQRIEERAKQKLLKDLYDYAQREASVANYCGARFKPQLSMTMYYGNSYAKDEYRITNDFTQQIFDEKLPVYIERITDEILNKIDEIDYLVSEKRQEVEF